MGNPITPDQMKGANQIAGWLILNSPDGYIDHNLDEVIRVYREGIERIFPQYSAAILDDAVARFRAIIVAEIKAIAPDWGRA